MDLDPNPQSIFPSVDTFIIHKDGWRIVGKNVLLGCQRCGKEIVVPKKNIAIVGSTLFTVDCECGLSANYFLGGWIRGH